METFPVRTACKTVAGRPNGVIPLTWDVLNCNIIRNRLNIQPIVMLLGLKSCSKANGGVLASQLYAVSPLVGVRVEISTPPDKESTCGFYGLESV